MQLPHAHGSCHETQSQPSANAVGRHQEDNVLRKTSQNFENA